MDYDSLMKTEMEDDLNVPQLGLFHGADAISEVISEECDPEQTINAAKDTTDGNKGSAAPESSGENATEPGVHIH